MRQLDQEVIDIHRRMDESGCKHDIDKLHNTYVNAIATNDTELLESFSDDTIEFIKDALQVLQQWGSETLFWILSFGESFPREDLRKKHD